MVYLAASQTTLHPGAWKARRSKSLIGLTAALAASSISWILWGRLLLITSGYYNASFHPESSLRNWGSNGSEPFD